MASEVSDAVKWFVREHVLRHLTDHPEANDVTVGAALGITKQHVGAIKKTDRGIGLKTAMGLAGSLKMQWPEFVEAAEHAYREGIKSGAIAPTTGTRGTVAQHPDWPVALAEAKRVNRKGIPVWAFDAAGTTSGSRVPQRLSAEFVRELAEFWWTHATDDELANAETESVKREMAEEDARRRR